MISFYLKMISCCLKMISCYLKMISCYLTMISCYLTMISCYLTMISCYLTMIICFLRMISCYLTMISCYLTMISCYLYNDQLLPYHDQLLPYNDQLLPYDDQLLPYNDQLLVAKGFRQWHLLCCSSDGTCGSRLPPAGTWRLPWRIWLKVPSTSSGWRRRTRTVSANRVVNQRSCLFLIQREGKCQNTFCLSRGFLNVKQWAVLTCSLQVAQTEPEINVCLYKLNVER